MPKGFKHSMETRRKISESSLGRVCSQETREKMGEANKAYRKENPTAWKKERHPNWKGGGLWRICRKCGKEFYVDRDRIKAGNGWFCSRECVYFKKKIKRICKSCGTEFYVMPSRLIYTGANFCSFHCRSFYWNSRMPRISSIELIIKNMLKINKIKFKQQVPLENIAIVDFLLPDKRIIQCDGDYWHGLKKAKGKGFLPRFYFEI